MLNLSCGSRDAKCAISSGSSVKRWMVVAVLLAKATFIAHDFGSCRAQSSVFFGLTCLNSSMIEDSHMCAYAKACCCNASCASWKQGRLTLPSQQKQQPRHTERACSFDGPGSLVDGAWLPDNGCGGGACMSPEQAHTVLVGTHLIIAGDSLLRQLYMRLVTHLRGFEDVVEHFFHSDSQYSRNATHDLFQLTCGNMGEDIQGASFGLCNLSTMPGIASEELSVQFVWDPLWGRRLDTVERLFNHSTCTEKCSSPAPVLWGVVPPTTTWFKTASSWWTFSSVCRESP
jgi:hypothetical protein